MGEGRETLPNGATVTNILTRLYTTSWYAVYLGLRVYFKHLACTKVIINNIYAISDKKNILYLCLSKLPCKVYCC
jgi:hypothetical protein